MTSSSTVGTRYRLTEEGRLSLQAFLNAEALFVHDLSDPFVRAIPSNWLEPVGLDMAEPDDGAVVRIEYRSGFVVVARKEGPHWSVTGQLTARNWGELLDGAVSITVLVPQPEWLTAVQDLLFPPGGARRTPFEHMHQLAEIVDWLLRQRGSLTESLDEVEKRWAATERERDTARRAERDSLERFQRAHQEVLGLRGALIDLREHAGRQNETIGDRSALGTAHGYYQDQLARIIREHCDPDRAQPSHAGFSINGRNQADSGE